MSAAPRWRGGSVALRAELEAWLARGGGADARAQVLRDNARRRLVQLHCDDGESVVVKHYRVASGLHPRRERWKARLGRAPADREWHALAQLHAAGVQVPQPLACAALDGGDRLLVLRFVAGAPLADALAAARPLERREILTALGARVAEVHAAGLVHGDLHLGNVLVTPGGPVLLDLQHARYTRREGARLRDIGRLDFSLASLVSTPDRLRLRAAALGLAAPHSDAARRRLRAVGAAARARGRQRAASRTRRALRPGRLYARLRLADGQGLRMRTLDELSVTAACAAHREALARGDARVLKENRRSRVTAVRAGDVRIVVKEAPPRGLLSGFADLLRGSPAHRAWRAGHGLHARDIGAARPLAFMERRRLGLPVSSLVLLEDLSPATPASALQTNAASAHDVLGALAQLAITLHRWEIDHGDLKASHVFVRTLARAPGPEPALDARPLAPGRELATLLIDLEGVRFRRRLSTRRRIRALSQLNASLPDAFPASERCLAFARYARALPFANGRQRALATVVAESLARRHYWTGADCVLAAAPDGRGAPAARGTARGSISSSGS